MNEYQDQVVWFRAEVENKGGTDWVWVGDYDTREEGLEAVYQRLANDYSGRKFKVNKMHGSES
jgi:hypothetical protein